MSELKALANVRGRNMSGVGEAVLNIVSGMALGVVAGMMVNSVSA